MNAALADTVIQMVHRYELNHIHGQETKA